MEACTLPTMVIARQHMWGVSPTGPYYLDKQGSTKDRVKHVRFATQQLHYETNAMCCSARVRSYTGNSRENLAPLCGLKAKISSTAP